MSRDASGDGSFGRRFMFHDRFYNVIVTKEDGERDEGGWYIVTLEKPTSRPDEYRGIVFDRRIFAWTDNGAKNKATRLVKEHVGVS